MKTRFNFNAYDPRGRTMTVSEGETIPLGWFISVEGSAPAEVTELTTVVGRTIDRSGGDGDGEVLERHLSIQTAAQSAAAVAAAAAQAEAVVSAAKYAEWAAAVKAKAVKTALAKAAAAVEAAAAKTESDRIAAATQLVRAEFVRCGWVAARQQVRWETGGPDTSHIPVDGEMYVYRREFQSEGYSLKDQDRSYFYQTGYSHSETVVATHPAYAAALSAALAAEGDILAAVRLSMGDIVTPLAPTQEEILAKQAEELAANKAANAARRQASRDAEAAELAAKKAARLKRYSAPAESPAAAPALSSSVNLNDPWGSLSTLKL